MKVPELRALLGHFLGELQDGVVPLEAMEQNIVHRSRMTVPREVNTPFLLQAARVVPEPLPVVLESATARDEVVKTRGESS